MHRRLRKGLQDFLQRKGSACTVCCLNRPFHPILQVGEAGHHSHHQLIIFHLSHELRQAVKELRILIPPLMTIDKKVQKVMDTFQAGVKSSLCRLTDRDSGVRRNLLQFLRKCYVRVEQVIIILIPIIRAVKMQIRASPGDHEAGRPLPFKHRRHVRFYKQPAEERFHHIPQK